MRWRVVVRRRSACWETTPRSDGTSFRPELPVWEHRRVIEIRTMVSADVDAVVELGSRAWAPVHPSIEATFSSDIYRSLVHDADGEQRDAIRRVCADPQMDLLVAVIDGVPAGFLALDPHDGSAMAEVHMVAVDPDHQRRGVAEALMAAAERRAAEHGAEVLMVETGGDPGHGPARSLYESVGYRLVPVARYFKRIG